MSLPRTIPATARQALAAALAAAGLQLGDHKPGSRITLLVDHQGTTWQVTYLGSGCAWGVTGPGQERPRGVTTDDVAGIITAPAEEPEPTADAPATYLRTPVPAAIRQAWDSPLADGWRLGVRSATAAGTSTAPHVDLADRPQEPAPSPEGLWSALADVLNALAAAGRHPAFHDLSGSANGWAHQPYVSSSAHAHTPWVVWDLAARRYVVTTRERALSGEHSRRPRRKRR
ncbi:hypothetical protein ACOZDE_18890 [Streptomyces griseoincarnatus]